MLKYIFKGRITKNFLLSFDAIRSLSTSDDLAIDDIKLKYCQFPEARPRYIYIYIDIFKVFF